MRGRLRRRARLTLAGLAILSLVALCGATVTLSSARSGDTGPEAAASAAPDGFRDARREERREMNAAARRADKETGERYAWLINAPPNATSFGTICGKQDGKIKRTPLRTDGDGWKVYDASGFAKRQFKAACKKANTAAPAVR